MRCICGYPATPYNGKAVYGLGRSSPVLCCEGGDSCVIEKICILMQVVPHGFGGDANAFPVTH